MASFDAKELHALAADLGRAPKNAAPYLGKAIEVTSRKVKDGWAAKVGGGLNAKLPASIDYEMVGASGFSGFGGSVLVSDIGFNLAKFASPLGFISEYGTSKHPARMHGVSTLGETNADFEKGVDAAIDDALKALNL
jgi:hypothetical protein